MNPKVSVIIPCYNAIDYIEETIESIINQSYDKIEIIIIDDGSTDGTFEYLSRLNYENLLIQKNIRKGACAARNMGFALSTGHFIQYLDADDLLSKEKIKKQMELLLSDINDSIVMCRTCHFYDSPENGVIADEQFLTYSSSPKKFLINLLGGNGKEHGMIAQHAWLTPRKLIEGSGGWNEDLNKDQDGEFFCRILSLSQKIIYSEECLVYYRKHISGLNIAGQKKRKHLESQLDALNSKAFHLESERNSIEFQKAMALQYKFLAINAYPDYKDISAKAISISKNYGGSSYLPVLGGRIIEFLKFTFGWRVAKSFHKWIHPMLIIFRSKPR